MSELQLVKIDLDKLRAQLLHDVITEEQIDQLFALIEDQSLQRTNLLHVVKEEHARMAAIVEACEATAAFIESYTLDSALARAQPTFSSIFRVYGKNARAAVAAVRPQADAFLAELSDARAVGASLKEALALNQAQLTAAWFERQAARAALEQIDRHVVGACESAFGGLPEPCEECSEMREIASQALAAMKEMRSE